MRFFARLYGQSSKRCTALSDEDLSRYTVGKPRGRDERITFRESRGKADAQQDTAQLSNATSLLRRFLHLAHHVYRGGLTYAGRWAEALHQDVEGANVQARKSYLGRRR